MDEWERVFHFLWREYGEAVASVFQQATKGNEQWVSPTPDLQPALLAASDVFDHLNLPYALGGSLASSMHGFPQLVQEVTLFAQSHRSSLCVKMRLFYQRQCGLAASFLGAIQFIPGFLSPIGAEASDTGELAHLRILLCQEARPVPCVPSRQ